MLEKEFINGWFTRWAAAAVIVSIPISILSSSCRDSTWMDLQELSKANLFI